MGQGDRIDEQAVEEAMDVLSTELAARFGALADTFGQWRKPETARAVLESVLAEIKKGFTSCCRPVSWSGARSPRPSGPAASERSKVLRLCRRSRREARPDADGSLQSRAH